MVKTKKKSLEPLEVIVSEPLKMTSPESLLDYLSSENKEYYEELVQKRFFIPNIEEESQELEEKLKIEKSLNNISSDINEFLNTKYTRYKIISSLYGFKDKYLSFLGGTSQEEYFLRIKRDISTKRQSTVNELYKKVQELCPLLDKYTAHLAEKKEEYDYLKNKPKEIVKRFEDKITDYNEAINSLEKKKNTLLTQKQIESLSKKREELALKLSEYICIRYEQAVKGIEEINPSIEYMKLLKKTILPLIFALKQEVIDSNYKINENIRISGNNFVYDFYRLTNQKEEVELGKDISLLKLKSLQEILSYKNQEEIRK